MERINIQLLMQNRKRIFKGGRLIKIADILEDREIIFGIEDVDKLIKVFEEKDDKITKFLYNLIPIISNIDVVTIEYKDFEKYCNLPPLKQSPLFLDMIAEVYEFIQEDMLGLYESVHKLVDAEGINTIDKLEKEFSKDSSVVLNELRDIKTILDKKEEVVIKNEW